MPYTVGEMAKMLDVPASTLRYYDKEGLLPFVARSSGGIRLFQDSDLEWLRVIGCMKKAGMSIKDIRQYIELAMQAGYSTAPDEVRNLGFGAGMGLPNMKKYTDDMKIETELGVGTKITMEVNLM